MLSQALDMLETSKEQKTINNNRNFFIIFDNHISKGPEWGKRLIIPILGCKVPVIGRLKTIMSADKNTMSNKKVISFEEISKEKNLKEPMFSQGLYHWVMFILSFYTRVRENLKIDFESFVILQVVVSHSLYEINKSGNKSFGELEHEITDIINNKITHKNKLTFASIAEVLQLPRETVRRKVISLQKKDILFLHNSSGVKLGLGYKKIYKEFVSQTTLDISSLIKKWKKSGTLENLLEQGLKNE